MALTEKQKEIADSYLETNNYEVRNKKLFNTIDNYYCEGHQIYRIALGIRKRREFPSGADQNDVIDYICKKNNLSLNRKEVCESYSQYGREYRKKAAATSLSTRPNQASANRMPPPNRGVAKPSRLRVARRSDPNPEPLDGFSEKVVVRFSEVLLAMRNRRQ